MTLKEHYIVNDFTLYIYISTWHSSLPPGHGNFNAFTLSIHKHTSNTLFYGVYNMTVWFCKFITMHQAQMLEKVGYEF